MTLAYYVLPRETGKFQRFHFADVQHELAAPEGKTVEKIFDARWVSALVEAEALQGCLLEREDASYQQVADKLNLSIGALKTVIHRLPGRYRALQREEVARTVALPAAVDEELTYLRAALKG